MKIEQLLDVDTLRDHVADRRISETPNRWWSSVKIYNYGRKVQYDPTLWDDTTELCRGLIVNWDTGEVLARPFRKFFNIETNYRPETFRDALPAAEPEVTKKMDGSLGILWRYEGEVHIATRGSFGSAQARWATKFFNANYRDAFPVGWTPLFEIIYPENRIVVKYETAEMILLGMVNIETGEELPYAQLRQFRALTGVPVVQLFNGKNIDTMGLENTPNEEGYVLTWHRTAQSPLKIKVKFSEYQRIHRLVTGMSRKAIWELLRDGISLEDEFGDLPEHFKQWADVNVRTIKQNYADILYKVDEAWRCRPQTADRKELALYFLRHPPPIPSACFARLDGKDETECIWKAVRPRPEEAFETAVVEQ